MALIPLGGHVAVTPYLRSEALAAEVKKRSGLLLSPPTNSGQSWEGIPNQGYVAALPEDYDGPLKLGDRVVFSELAPKGFKDPDDEKRTLFVLKLEQILATVSEVEDEGSN